MSRKVLRRGVDKTGRLKQYFLRGHGSWFALAFSLINFTLIFYKLFLEQLYFIPEVFKSYALFFIVFMASYFPIATILGYLDYRKGTFSAEQTLAATMSPIWRQVFAKLERLEKDNKELLSKLHTLTENS
ncbi:MAG: hypothetical protein ACFFC7_07990 [Candidatus Hermodarchaeota archaeon]